MSAGNQPDLFAPLVFGNGASMAQTAQKQTSGGDLRHCAIGGSVQDANPAKARNGAASPPPVGNGAKPRNSIEERAALAKASLRELSTIRAELQPGMDAYQSMVTDARDRLRKHHDEYGMACGPDQIRARLKLHDHILLACQTHGQTVTAYKENKRLIDGVARELARIEEERTKR